MLAYDFPLLSLVWSMFWFFVMMSVFFTIIWCFVDNFRRRDHGGWAKAGWALLILAVPFFGMLIYIIARPIDPFLEIVEV